MVLYNGPVLRRWANPNAANTWLEDQTFNSDVIISHNGLIIENPAGTFRYTIQGAPISANRFLNLPLISGTDTLAAIGLAQAWTASQTFSDDVIISDGKELRFGDVGNSHHVGFQAPALTATQIWTLPTTDGSSGQQLQTNGSGVLSWSAGGSNASYGDDALLNLGTGNDIALVLRSTLLGADAELANVIVGTSDHLGVAANSLLVSNITADGDILFLINDGGNSKGLLKLVGSTGTVILGPMGATLDMNSNTITQIGNAGSQLLANAWTVVGNATQTISAETTLSNATAAIVLKIPAAGTSAAQVSLRQGVASGAADNMQYLLRYVGSDGGFSIWSADTDGSSTDGNVLFVADGTNDVQFFGGISTDGLSAPAAGAKLGSALFMAELASSVTAIEAFGEFWVKNDAPNTPYFTDDTDVDHQIQTADYAGITVDGNAGATEFNAQHEFTQIAVFDTDLPEVISNGAHGTDGITVGATGVYEVVVNFSGTLGANKTAEFFAFELASSGSAITSTTAAAPVVVTATAHGFSNGDKVKITGVGTADELNGHIYIVANKGDDTFELTEDEGNNINGAGFGVGSGGIATLATQLNAVHTHRKWSANDIGAMCAGGLASLTKDKVLEFYVKNITDATDYTFESGTFYVKRLS